jgi:putative peptide zinc metalloprotease protein
MNLARVFDVSLPELPKLEGKERLFRFNPDMVWREQTEKGITTFLTIAPQTRKVFTLTPERWKLVRLFDGKRSYEQIAKLWKQEAGVSASVETIRSFAEMLDSNGFWLRTPEEEAMARMEELKARERQVKKRSVRDVTKIYVFAVDKDQLITRAHRHLRFVYTPQFVIGSLVALVLMVSLWIARSDEVWRDSVLYWNMTDKTWRDVLEFYLIFAVVGFFHESGHALTAKNFGAEVHRVGMMLVYTVPAFFVETTEVIVYANYYQRMYVILAGFWYELMLCAIATFVWWGTAVGGTVHNIAYKFILVGGIMPVIFNMNPLMRLDGYLFLSKLVRISYLKERSTAFLTGWVQSRIFGLPAKVEPLPRRRAIFFAAYAFFSGIYTYSILLFLARITYRVVGKFSPDWAFLPAALVALVIFRSRIEKFAAFLKALFAKNKELMIAHRKSFAAAALAVVVFALLPLWRENVSAPVVLEPKEHAVLTAHVAGRVEDVMVREGQSVRAGTPIAILRGIDVESERANALSQLQNAAAAVTAAQLRYTDYAGADAERRHWSELARLAADKERRLSVTSPIAGVLVSPRIEDLRGGYLVEGSHIAEIQDLSVMRARIYVDESDMRSLTEISGDSIKLDSQIGSMRGAIEAIAPAPEEPPPGLIDLTKYKGMRPPPRYVVSVLLPNGGTLRAGMIGEAKLYGRRQSLAGKAWHPIADFAGRKLW